MKLLLLSSILFCCLLASCSKSHQDNDVSHRSQATLIAETVSKVSPDIKTKFDLLFDEWHTAYKTKSEVRFSSRYVYPNQLPQYDQLVAMGEEIIPLVIEKMTGPDYYFSRLVYEGIRPDDKLDSTDILGQERAEKYVTIWANRVLHK